MPGLKKKRFDQPLEKSPVRMLICTSAQAFAVAYQGEEHLVAPMLHTTHKHILSNQRQFKAENTACNPALGRSLRGRVKGNRCVSFCLESLVREWQRLLCH